MKTENAFVADLEAGSNNLRLLMKGELLGLRPIHNRVRLRWLKIAMAICVNLRYLRFLRAMKCDGAMVR